jgi:hypothetical protein
MESSLQVLGISKEIVEFKRSTNSLDDLLAMAEGNFRNMSKFLHPDRNRFPGAEDHFIRLSDAIEDLRDPDGLELAIERLVGEADKQANLRRIKQSFERDIEKRNLDAVLGLLVNIGQFNVLGITGPTSFLLQLGMSRTILDVSINHESTLYLTSQDEDVLPEKTEKVRFANGRWQEMYLANETRRWLSHKPEASTRVIVVGFIPTKALYHRSDATYEVVSEDRAELSDKLSESRVIPVWSEPSEAWFLQHIEAKPKKHSEVVVRNHRGRLAIIGSIQAKAIF